MWKASKEFGIGKAKTKDGKWFVVANYYPAGNMQGTYAENVFGPKDGKIVVPKPEGGAGAATAGAGSGAGDKHPKGSFSATVCYAVLVFSFHRELFYSFWRQYVSLFASIATIVFPIVDSRQKKFPLGCYFMLSKLWYRSTQPKLQVYYGPVQIT